IRLARERRSRLGLRGEPELALGGLYPTGPEQEHTEVEADRRIIRVGRGKRPEASERSLRRVLVELPHGTRHLRFDVVGIAPRRALEDTCSGHRSADSLEADAVEQLLPEAASLGGDA